MCCIRGICILAPGANVSANLTFYPVDSSSLKSHVEGMQFSGQHLGLRAVARTLIGGGGGGVYSLFGLCSTNFF